MNRAEGFFTGEQGVKIYYRSWLPENSMQAVLQIVHGFGEHGERYMNLVEKLLPRDFGVFCHDHRGHGKSSGPRTHVESFLDFIKDTRNFYARIIAPQVQDSPVFLLGHSMGSIVALNYLAHDQENYRGAILSGTGYEARSSPVMILLVRILSALFPRGRFSFPLPPAFISRDQEVVKEYSRDPLVEKKLSFRLAAEIFEWLRRGGAAAEKIEIPVFLQCGREDQSFKGEQVLLHRLGSEDKILQVYPGLYHEIYNELPEDREKVLGDLLNWLEERLKKNGQ